MSQVASILVAEEVELTEQSINDLIEEYQWIVHLKANHYYSFVSERDDLTQEGLIGLYEAIIGFDSIHGVAFTSFASICIDRKIINYLRSENRRKHEALNSYTSIFKPINTDESDTVLIDILDGGFKDPSSFLIEKDMYEQTEKLLRKKLTELEFAVAWLRVGGYRFDEMADVMGVSMKVIDNALFRARSKSVGFKDKVNLIINGVEGVQ